MGMEEFSFEILSCKKKKIALISVGTTGHILGLCRTAVWEPCDGVSMSFSLNIFNNVKKNKTCTVYTTHTQFN